VATEEERSLAIKKMVELLRGGATMLGEHCPLCGSPLFKLRSGEIVCPIHGRVFVAKSEEEVAEASVLGTLTELEKALVKRMTISIPSIERGEGGEEVLREVILALDAIERIERIKQILSIARRSSGGSARG